MLVQRTRAKQLRAPLTTLGHPKSMQSNFNSCSFNYKSDYRSVCGIQFEINGFNKPIMLTTFPWNITNG